MGTVHQNVSLPRTHPCAHLTSCADHVCCATPQHRNERLDELVSLGILDVAQRLQKEESNGDEIMSAYMHKMNTFSDDERDASSSASLRIPSQVITDMCHGSQIQWP